VRIRATEDVTETRTTVSEYNLRALSLGKSLFRFETYITEVASEDTGNHPNTRTLNSSRKVHTVHDLLRAFCVVGK
jgi:hypothetical protein